MLKLKRDENTKQVFANATDKDARICYLLRDRNDAVGVFRDSENQIVKFEGLLNHDASAFMTQLGKVK
jgi:hypothetical protein